MIPESTVALIEAFGLPWGIVFAEAGVIIWMWRYTVKHTVPKSMYDKLWSLFEGILTDMQEAVTLVADRTK